MRIFIVIGCILFINTLFAEDASRAVLIERIRPLGAVHSDEPLDTTVKATQVVMRSGEEIYNQHCSVCHASGVAGAPRFQEASEWDPRFKQAGGVKGLVSVAVKGINAMPPMGTCQNCTQDELAKAISYMLPKGKQ